MFNIIIYSLTVRYKWQLKYRGIFDDDKWRISMCQRLAATAAGTRHER